MHLRLWKGNMDIQVRKGLLCLMKLLLSTSIWLQFVTNSFATLNYIASYISKAEKVTLSSKWCQFDHIEC